MKVKRVDLLGIGHPLIDGLLARLRSSTFSGEVTNFKAQGAAQKDALLARALLHAEGEARHTVREIKLIQIDKGGNVSVLPDGWDLNLLRSYAFAREDPGEH